MQHHYVYQCIPYNTKQCWGKLWGIGNFKNLVGKTLANQNELSLCSSIKTHNVKLKTKSFILSSCVGLKWCACLQGHLW